MKSKIDKLNPKIKAGYNKVIEFGSKLENDINFFMLRIARIRPENQKKFIDYPGLKEYRHLLERLFREARYLLSENEEKIINLKAKTSHVDWVNMTSQFLSKEEGPVIMPNGKKQIKNFSEIISLMISTNKKTRDSAAKTFNEIITKHLDVAEAEINAVLGNKKIDDQLRKTPRPDYSRHLVDDVDTRMVDSLIKAVSARFDIAHRYYKLKAKLLGVKKLRYHERNVPYGKIDKKYSYEETTSIVYNALNNLDNEFAEIFKRFNENGQVDVYPRKGKSNGAFCFYMLKSQPSYIMLNHTDKLDDVLTVAHEFGHAINNEMIKKREGAINFGTSTATAEVASTFIEDFVAGEIMKKADEETKLSLMINQLDSDINAIQRQIAGYMFEIELHNEYRNLGYLSKENIGRIFKKAMHSYMGDYVSQDPGSENWWVYWNHIRYFFYVYSYASGLLISKTLQKMVNNDQENIKKVKQYLSTGLSKSPVHIFRELGIDITEEEFWLSGLEEIDNLLKETEKLAKKLGKI